MHLTNDQIQVLLVEKLAGTITPENDALIEKLLAEDPAVRHQWLRMQRELGQLGGAPPAIDEEKAWTRVSTQLRPANRRAIPLLKRAAAAAAVIIIIAGAIILRNRRPQDTLAQTGPDNTTPSIALVMDNGRRLPLKRRQIISLGALQIKADQQQMLLPTEVATTEDRGSAKAQSSTEDRSAAEWATLEVPRTFAYKISLSDGSEVWLNAQSHLRFPLTFQSPKREVFIEGEAYFKVSKDPQHPFIVHTDRTEVLVVGTQFNLNTYEKSNIRTALVEGAVITRDSTGHSIALRPGMQSVYEATQNFSTATFDERETLSWLRGIYYFHDTPLAEISKMLVRWYNVSIDFKKSDLQNKTFTGELRKSQSLQSFLDNLNLSIEMHAYEKDGKVFFQ